MWKIIALSITLLLGGCQFVTIDEAPINGEQTNSKEPEQHETSDGKMTQDEFIEVLDTVFHLQWSDRKTEDARELRYLALGDSLTRGIGDGLGQGGYTGRLSQEMEKWPAITAVTVDNRGKNGRRSEKVLELLARGHYDEELREADLITMTIGGNDVMKVVKKDLFALKKEMFDEARGPFATHYSEIVREIRLRNPQVPIILVGFYNPFSIVTDEFTPFEPIIQEWNDEMRRVAEADTRACFVPIDDLFTSNADLVYHTDFFHPNATGYERMTERIVDSMIQCNIEKLSDGLIGFEEASHE